MPVFRGAQWLPSAFAWVGLISLWTLLPNIALAPFAVILSIQPHLLNLVVCFPSDSLLLSLHLLLTYIIMYSFFTYDLKSIKVYFN